jgi:hypothetical protein
MTFGDQLVICETSTLLIELTLSSPVKSAYRQLENPDSQMTIIPFIRTYLPKQIQDCGATALPLPFSRVSNL